MRVLLAASIALVVGAGCRQEGVPPTVAVIASDAAAPSVDALGAPTSSEPRASAAPDRLSYEQAMSRVASAEASNDGMELTDAQLGAPLRNSAFINTCGVTDTMKATIRVVVLDGQALGVSVYVSPPTPEVAQCVEQHVRSQHWARSAHFAAFTTTY